MPSVVVIGTQWGDEGKGKITDFLAERADYVVRFQGGNNAGHTIVIGDNKYAVHLVPSGVFHSDKVCIMGNGMVIDPRILKEEVEYLHGHGFSTDNLQISSRAHIIMPYHLVLDRLEEEMGRPIPVGTTGRGIGPAYVDKYARIGLRVCDLIDSSIFKEKLEWLVTHKNAIITKIYDGEPLRFSDIYEEYSELAKFVRPYVVDTVAILNNALEDGKYVLFEGAQGAMLDIDHGTYPFLTSSNPTGVCTGAGVGPKYVSEVVGVVKAYTSRVGDGAFPTELHDEVGNRIRDIGKEYGTTTGRPRRVGWLDSVVLKHACRVAGTTSIAINSLDVLSGLETVKIAVGYEYEGEILENYPASNEVLKRCKPIYEELPGWSEDITGVRSLHELPENTRNYIKRVEELVGRPAKVFSVGPKRSQTNVLEPIW